MGWGREPHARGAPVAAGANLDDRLRPCGTDNGERAWNCNPTSHTSTTEGARVAVLACDSDAVVQQHRLGGACSRRDVESSNDLTSTAVGVDVLDGLGARRLRDLELDGHIGAITVGRAGYRVDRAVGLLLERGVAMARLVVGRADQPLPRARRGEGDAGLDRRWRVDVDIGTNRANVGTGVPPVGVSERADAPLGPGSARNRNDLVVRRRLDRDRQADRCVVAIHLVGDLGLAGSRATHLDGGRAGLDVETANRAS